MANNIYVGGFPYKTTKEELAALFGTCGTVLSAKVILDRETGRPKGFGFVEMSTDAEAVAAVAKLNGHFIGDRKIFAVLGRVEKNREGYTPKPSFAPKPAAKPGFVERRSGKDRRGSAVPGSERRDAPATPPAPSSATPAPAAKWEKKPWVKKPFDPEKKAWVKKPFDAEKKPFDPEKKAWVKKPFDPEKKPWVKKPFDADKKPFDPEKKAWVKKPFDPEKKPWVKKPFDPEKKPWAKKPFDGEKKPWVKKPFDKDKKPFVKSVPPVRGKKWTPPQA